MYKIAFIQQKESKGARAIWQSRHYCQAGRTAAAAAVGPPATKENLLFMAAAAAASTAITRNKRTFTFLPPSEAELSKLT